jgi:hypothetical protein
MQIYVNNVTSPLYAENEKLKYENIYLKKASSVSKTKLNFIEHELCMNRYRFK